MKRRVWTVQVPGYRPFSMVLMEGALDHAAATREARISWPDCQVLE